MRKKGYLVVYKVTGEYISSKSNNPVAFFRHYSKATEELEKELKSKKYIVANRHNYKDYYDSIKTDVTERANKDNYAIYLVTYNKGKVGLEFELIEEE